MAEALDWLQEVVATPTGLLAVGAAALIGVASAAYILNRPRPLDLGLDYDKQGVALQGGVYASKWTAETGRLVEYLYDDAKTVYECFLRGRRITGDGKCLGARTGANREYEWMSYNEVFDRTQAFGSGLSDLGLKPGQESFLGIFAQNRPEWTVADLSCQMYSRVTVALYDTLGVDAVRFTIKHCEITTVVCDTAERASLLLHNSMPSLKVIVMVEDVSERLLKAAAAVGIHVVKFSHVEEMGKRNLQEPVPPKPSDLTTVLFTSGTTGDPKGVMLSHLNMVSCMAGGVMAFRIFHELCPDDIHISYLPLAHSFERLNLVAFFCHGCCVGYYSRDIKLLFDDLQTLKPTIFPTVPRLLNKIRDKVISSTEGSKIKTFLLNQAFRSKLAEVKRRIIRRNSIWDKLVFHKIQQVLGGRVKLVVTGSAPLSNEVHDFVRCALGCLVIEGYGQSECCAAATSQIPGDPVSGHVGAPIASNYIKLIDVPEMDYFARDNKGEICVKGNNVTSGYYRSHEKTMEAFTHDGWLRTGDIGVIHPNGTLSIIDRCKHIFKLSQGEYIAPERLEAIYTRSKYIMQCFVDGNSLQSRCVAIVVPDPEIVHVWASKNKCPMDIKLLCNNENLKDTILKDMLDTGENAGLKGFEQVLDICLEPEPFSMESNLMTPTFKNKRPQLRRHFAEKVSAVYAKQTE